MLLNLARRTLTSSLSRTRTRSCYYSLPTPQLQHRTFAHSSPSMAFKVVSTADAPSAIGPYSQALVHNNIAYLSGCIPLDPKSMTVVEGGVEEQTTQVLKNLEAVVKASGSSKDKVIKVTVFLKSMNDFVAVNKLYEEFFAPHKPARSAVEVARLPKDVLVEIECIAAVE